MHQNVQGIAGTAQTSDDANVFGIGASVNFSGVNLVGYYYNGSGVGTTGILSDAFAGGTGNSRDSDGGYVQASFKVPGVGTKLAASWGTSNLDCANAADCAAHPTLVDSNEMWTRSASIVVARRQE